MRIPLNSNPIYQGETETKSIQSSGFRRLFAIHFICFVSLILTGCFEYEETITFAPDFSGSIEISYVVPLKKNSSESLIKFLPTTEAQIQANFNKGFFAKSINILDFRFERLTAEETDTSLFKEKGKVSYRIEFSDITQVSNALIGTTQVKKKGNTLYVKREFKGVSSLPEQNASIGIKKVYAETVRLLKDSSLKFRVNFPISSACRSNRGEINLGRLNYELPLAETVEKAGNRSWDYRITNIY